MQKGDYRFYHKKNRKKIKTSSDTIYNTTKNATKKGKNYRKLAKKSGKYPNKLQQNHAKKIIIYYEDKLS